MLELAMKLWRSVLRTSGWPDDERSDDEILDGGAAVNATAVTVALCRAEESARSDAWFDDPLAEHVARIAERNPAREPSPGLVRWVATRTRFLDELVLDAVDPDAGEGVRQVVILGAGLDARAYRLAWPAGAHLFEVDRASVLSVKQRLAQDIGLRPRCTRHAVVADVTSSAWLDSLAAAGWSATRPTCWLAEGLFSYLAAPARDRLLGQLAAASPPGSRLGAAFDSAAFDDSRAPADPRDWLRGLGWDASLASLADAAAAYGRPTGRPLGQTLGQPPARADGRGARARDRALAATLADATPLGSGDSPSNHAQSR